MALDPTMKQIFETQGTLISEIRNLSNKLDDQNEKMCDLECRTRQIERTGINKEDHKILVDKVDGINLTLAKYIGYATVIFIMIQYIFKFG